MRRLFFLASLAAGGLCAAPALADPCKAIPDQGPAPGWLRPGALVSGPVVYVGDGDSLCVATGADRSDQARWVEIRLADFYAPELHEPGGRAAKDALERTVRGKQIACWVEKRSWDRAVAQCRLGRKSLGDLMRAAGVKEGGNGR